MYTHQLKIELYLGHLGVLLQHEEETENKEKQKENEKLPTYAIICFVKLLSIWLSIYPNKTVQQTHPKLVITKLINLTNVC